MKSAPQHLTRHHESISSWLPIAEAPKDRIIRGRESPDDEVGRPIRWRDSRRLDGHKWVDYGVWHAAETRGAVRLKPIEWQEWEAVPMHFELPAEETEAA
jgi:hypothetical protein